MSELIKPIVAKTTLPGCDFKGLFAPKKYKKEEIIGYYYGSLSNDPIDTVYSFHHSISNLYIYPDDKCLFRYLNHAPKTVLVSHELPGIRTVVSIPEFVHYCNVDIRETLIAEVDGKLIDTPAIQFVAKRAIAEKEELLLDYGPDYEYTKEFYTRDIYEFYLGRSSNLLGG